MNVYPLTQVDRDLLLAGADLEAVLADRERERLERGERSQARLSEETIARFGRHAPEPDEDRYAPSRPVAA
jgi:hypothetical protein